MQAVSEGSTDEMPISSLLCCIVPCSMIQQREPYTETGFLSEARIGTRFQRISNISKKVLT